MFCSFGPLSMAFRHISCLNNFLIQLFLLLKKKCKWVEYWHHLNIKISLFLNILHAKKNKGFQHIFHDSIEFSLCQNLIQLWEKWMRLERQIVSFNIPHPPRSWAGPFLLRRILNSKLSNSVVLWLGWKFAHRVFPIK